MPSNDVIEKIVLCHLDLLFEGQQFKFYISETEKLAQKFMVDICRFRDLPSNGVIAKMVRCDLDILFEGKLFQILNF